VYHVFVTPTEIDPISFTMLGVNAKVNDAPIGFFGTGLKYAIGVLLREGYRICIDTHTRSYLFRVIDREFRGKLLRICQYFDTEWRDLPFTTDLGKNWTVDEAFRELYSNTLDEGGWDLRTNDNSMPPPGFTYITIQHPQKLEEFSSAKQRMFLNTQPIMQTKHLEVHPLTSQAIFYRGIRVGNNQHPALYTYNILDELTLTEDRTLKYSWTAEHVLRNFYQEECHSAEDIYNAITHEGSLEYKLNIIAGAIPSLVTREFKEAFQRMYKERPTLMTQEHYKVYYQMFGRPSRKRARTNEVRNKVLRKAIAVVQSTELFSERHFSRIEVLDKSEFEAGVLALYEVSADMIHINELALDRPLRDVIATLLEELIHAEYLISDFSRAMQEKLIEIASGAILSQYNMLNGRPTNE
jgi:hypothetical protein